VAVLDLRLRRLERARRDHHGVFFLAIGRDDTEIEAEIANARANLTLQLNDIVVRLPWARGKHAAVALDRHALVTAGRRRNPQQGGADSA
jgi:hypothetical protein